MYCLVKHLPRFAEGAQSLAITITFIQRLCLMMNGSFGEGAAC